MKDKIKCILACGYFSLFLIVEFWGKNIVNFWCAVFILSTLTLFVQKVIEIFVCTSETHVTEKWAVGRNVFQTVVDVFLTLKIYETLLLVACYFISYPIKKVSDNFDFFVWGWMVTAVCVVAYKIFLKIIKPASMYCGKGKPLQKERIKASEMK